MVNFQLMKSIEKSKLNSAKLRKKINEAHCWKSSVFVQKVLSCAEAKKLANSISPKKITVECQ